MAGAPVPSPVAARPRKVRLLGLDLMRGLCACSVAAYHFMSWTGTAEVESMGTFAVYIFFILSALTMMYSYAEVFEDQIGKRALQVFYLNRIARVLPLLAIVAVLMAGLRLVNGNSELAPLASMTILTGTGLFSLHLPGLSSAVVGGWSLGIEVLFYMLFPAIALLLSGLRVGRMLWIIAGLVVVQLLAIDLSTGYDLPMEWYLYVSPIVFAPFFGLGLAIFLVDRHPQAANLWIGLALLVGVVGFSSVWSGPIIGNPVIYTLLTAGSAAAVWAFYNSDLPHWLVQPGQALGDWSYAIYLGHWFAFKASAVAATALGVALPIQAAFFAALVLVLAALTYRFVEKPLQQRIRNDGRPGARVAARAHR